MQLPTLFEFDALVLSSQTLRWSTSPAWKMLSWCYCRTTLLLRRLGTIPRKGEIDVWQWRASHPHRTDTPPLWCLPPAFVMNIDKQSFSVNTRKQTASSKQPLMTCILYPMTSSRAGRLPWSFYEIWNESSLTTLNKKDTADLKINEIMNCRPICIGEAIKKEITKALYRPYMNKIIAGS